MLDLQRPFPRIQNNDRIAYGGNQMWSENELIRSAGCGPVAALTLLHYLKDAETIAPLPLSLFNTELRHLCREYFPLIPRVGITACCSPSV